MTKPSLACVLLGILLPGAAALAQLTAGATRIRLDAIPDAPAIELGRASFDTTDGWQNITLAEDKPMRFSAAAAEGEYREGRGAVRFTLETDIGPMGMKYFDLGRLKGTLVGSDGYSFWVKGDGSGGTLEIRLSQSDWSAWDSPPLTLDFADWRQVVVLREDCRFHNWGRNGPRWDDVKVFALRYSGRSGSLLIDDLRFHRGTAAMKVRRLPPPAPPVTLRIDTARELAPIPPMLKGVDFALINWGANAADLNFGPATERLFRESGAKLVRFWTYCPPLGVSPAPDRYDWTRFDAQMRKITDAGAATIMTCCFTPTWLSVDGTKEGMPKDWAAYEKLIADTVRHCKEQGFNVAYWEVWNEPNLGGGGFLKGGLKEFLEIYRHFAAAVRHADPTALVGGPGLASPDMVWMRAFVEFCDANDLPMDFVSWHVYDLMPDGLAASIEATRKILAAHPRFRDAQMVIDEWQASGGPRNLYDTEYAAAYQIAALHRMIEGGLAAQTFFAFKESSPDFASDDGRNWGMITRGDIPKASYHSFRAFAQMTGPRLTVSGGDVELGAIATRQADAVEVLVYRLQSDLEAPDRAVRLELAGWDAGAVELSMQLIDNAHSNALFDRSTKEMETVGRWSPVRIGELSAIEVPLRPLSVAKFRITSTEPAPGEMAIRPAQAAAPAPRAIAAGQRFELPAWGPRGAVAWKGPRGWRIEGRSTVAPVTERQARKAYFIASSPGEAWTFAVDVLPPGVEVFIDTIESPAPPAPRRAHVTLRSSLAAGLSGALGLWSDSPMRIIPASHDVNIPAGGAVREARLTFDVAPTDEHRGPVMIYPRLELRSLLDEDGRQMSEAYLQPLAAPEPDPHTTLLCSLASLEAIARPQVGPGGGFDGQAPGFAGSRFGQGALLTDAMLRFPGSVLPASAGTVECWIAPRWDGPSAPAWGTLLLRSGASGWARSMWDVHIIRECGRSLLRFNLHEEDGRTHTVAADISAWKSAQPHHVMFTWNASSGRIAICIDGRPADEKVIAGGLSLRGGEGQVRLNHTSGRPPLNAVVGPLRISRIERIAGRDVPAPSVEVRSAGLLLERW